MSTIRYKSPYIHDSTSLGGPVLGWLVMPFCGPSAPSSCRDAECLRTAIVRYWSGPWPLELVHGLRRHQGSARGATRALWPITRQTANRQVGAIMRTAGIEGPQACPRGLRHSHGVAAVTAGVPLPTVAAVLGHASLTTTAIGAEARELVSRVWA